MPKKKQVTFESNVAGKFIPREDPPSVSASGSVSQDHRYNGKMAELLANSCDSTNETHKIYPEKKEEKIESSRPSSRPFHRRIVTALETLRRRGSSNSNVKTLKVSPPNSPKSQPITFGQLREASSNKQNEDSVHQAEKNNENLPNEIVPPSVEEILENFYSKIQVDNVSAKKNWPNVVVSNPTPSLLLNEQNRNRPPPPSYSSSVANFARPLNVNSNPFFIRPTAPLTLVEQFYPHLPNNSNLNVRPAPPPYETSNVESPAVEEKSPNEISTNGPGFDREFSRLLYGKDSARTRQRKQKRKALSDPVKKSVEEAGRSAEKSHRRLTAHLNRRDTVKEEEETNSDSYELEKPNFPNFLPARRPPRNSHRFSNRRQSSRNAIVPANPVLKKTIPQFLRVYSQAPSSNDNLLEWHLFGLEELESFEAMITKLYKDETFSCIQPFENYRLALLNLLEKKSFLSSTEDEEDSLTTSL